jgi:hypothetical protein
MILHDEQCAPGQRRHRQTVGSSPYWCRQRSSATIIGGRRYSDVFGWRAATQRPGAVDGFSGGGRFVIPTATKSSTAAGRASGWRTTLPRKPCAPDVSG